MVFFSHVFPHIIHQQALTAAMELKGAAKAHIGLRHDVQFGKAPSLACVRTGETPMECGHLKYETWGFGQTWGFLWNTRIWMEDLPWFNHQISVKTCDLGLESYDFLHGGTHIPMHQPFWCSGCPSFGTELPISSTFFSPRENRVITRQTWWKPSMKWDIGRIHLINNMILSFTKCPSATTYDTSYAEKNISTVGFGYLISDKPIVVPEGRLIFLTLDDFGHSITRQGHRIKTQQYRKHQNWEACGMGYQQELVTWMIPNHWANDLADEATEIMDPSFMDYLGSRPSGTEGWDNFLAQPG